jgi:nucleoid DNA-binding protein
MVFARRHRERFSPATGEAVQVKASRKIAVRPSKELKEAV